MIEKIAESLSSQLDEMNVDYTMSTDPSGLKWFRVGGLDYSLELRPCENTGQIELVMADEDGDEHTTLVCDSSVLGRWARYMASRGRGASKPEPAATKPGDLTSTGSSDDVDAEFKRLVSELSKRGIPHKTVKSKADGSDMVWVWGKLYRPDPSLTAELIAGEGQPNFVEKTVQGVYREMAASFTVVRDVDNCSLFLDGKYMVKFESSPGGSEVLVTNPVLDCNHRIRIIDSTREPLFAHVLAVANYLRKKVEIRSFVQDVVDEVDEQTAEHEVIADPSDLEMMIESRRIILNYISGGDPDKVDDYAEAVFMLTQSIALEKGNA